MNTCCGVSVKVSKKNAPPLGNIAVRYDGVSITLALYFGFTLTILLLATFTTRFRRSARYGMISLTLTALFALIIFETSSALAGTPYFFASFAVIRWNFGNSRSRYLRPFAS